MLARERAQPTNRARPTNGAARALLANGAALVLCGLIAGVAVAGAAFPAVAMSGLAVKAGLDSFAQLPAELMVQRAPQISYVYAADGRTLIATMYDENRHDVSISQVSPLMQKAIMLFASCGS